MRDRGCGLRRTLTLDSSPLRGRNRHRLNRHGNREANWALYMNVVGRLRTDERTRRCVAKRTAEGKT
jgi:hypothetical protein